MKIIKLNRLRRFLSILRKVQPRFTENALREQKIYLKHLQKKVELRSYDIREKKKILIFGYKGGSKLDDDGKVQPRCCLNQIFFRFFFCSCVKLRP